MQFDDYMPSYLVSRVFSANLPIQLDAEQKSNFENCMPMRSSAVIRAVLPLKTSSLSLHLRLKNPYKSLRLWVTILNYKYGTYEKAIISLLYLLMTASIR